jgi:glycosyltransferase involved in cell wall biosynthesis
LASSSSPSRIGILTERYPPDVGGLAVSVRRLAVGLAARGLAVDVLALSSGDAPGSVRTCEEDGVRVHRLGRRKKVEDALADWVALVASEHRREPFRVLHAYYVTRPAFVAVYAGGMLCVPAIVSARGNDLDRAVLDPSKASHTLHALQHAAAITSNSQDLARSARALAPGRRVEVIPNGVNTELFRALPRDMALSRRLGLDDTPVVGFVGEAREKKGLAHLLLAFAAVSRKRAAKLLLLGGVRKDDRPMIDVFRAQHPALSVVVVDDVAHQELPACYALLDVLVMPSLRDGLPNALLEGMACERAVVATDAGGMPDALTHEENGLMVRVGDVEGLAAGVERLLTDAELRASFGASARRTILERFTPAREIDLTLALYAEVAGAPDGSSSS